MKMIDKNFILYAGLLLMLSCQTSQKCASKDAYWPSSSALKKLKQQVKGHLYVGRKSDLGSDERNPFVRQEHPGLMQTKGWHEAWSPANSPFVIRAESVEDVVHGVNFAREHNLRLVIKGTGHDYLGRSSATNSLLIWTHPMRDIKSHANFIPAACIAVAGEPAVSVEAGARWLEVYQHVTLAGGHYVQGGGCNSVGAAGGFLQGGGFGSFSRKFGTAAANLLEAEVVLADGSIRLANACQNQDLFWALRGGGGGTFGVVTRITLRTHPLPKTFGSITGKINAKTDDAFKQLIKRFARFYRSVNGEHFGEIVNFTQKNELELRLHFQELSEIEASAKWQPFFTWVKKHPEFEITQNFKVEAKSPSEHWTFKNQQAQLRDSQSEAPYWWWSAQDDEIATTIYAYYSRWIPQNLFTEQRLAEFTNMIFKASRVFGLSLHFNKGLAGANPLAVSRARETSLHPGSLDAMALLIMGAQSREVHNPQFIAQKKAELRQAFAIVKHSTPEAGTYGNETDYFLENWESEIYGPNFSRLLKIKQAVDSQGLFQCHHCIPLRGQNLESIQK
jgi:FAD binding domain/Berberine and berberine like